MNDFEFTGEVLRHGLQPGDVIVLRSSVDLNMQQADLIRVRAERQFSGHRCLVLGPHMELEVVRPEPAS